MKMVVELEAKVELYNSKVLYDAYYDNKSFDYKKLVQLENHLE